jgi:hypothetical protein
MTHRRSSMGCLSLGGESLINLVRDVIMVSPLSQARICPLARSFITVSALSQFLAETVSLSHTYIPKV